LYERSGGTTTLVSTGPTGGNGAADALYQGASADGQHVFFGTSEPLGVGDTDSSFDIYDRFGGTTSLVSTGPTDGNRPSDASFKFASRDGSRVFFETYDWLTGTDVDQYPD